MRIHHLNERKILVSKQIWIQSLYNNINELIKMLLILMRIKKYSMLLVLKK